MTPEERAAGAIQVIVDHYRLAGRNHLSVTEIIAAAIHAAVEAEREACAEVAEFCTGHTGSVVVRTNIAAAIRRRKEATDEADGTATQNAPAQ